MTESSNVDSVVNHVSVWPIFGSTGAIARRPWTLATVSCVGRKYMRWINMRDSGTLVSASSVGGVRGPLATVEALSKNLPLVILIPW